MDLKQELKRFVKRGEFDLLGGGESNIYFDLREAFGSPKILDALANELHKLLNKDATCIAALGLGGVPLATALSSKSGLKLTLLRDSIKNHGLNKSIEGYVPNAEDKVVIVDDLFTIGTSLKKSIEILKPTNAEILCCYVVVKRGEGELSVPLHFLYTLDDLINE